MKIQRGKEKLVFRGYVYVHQRSRGTTHYFKCEHDNCPGRATLKGVANFNTQGGTVTTGTEHNHSTIEGRKQTLEAVSKMRIAVKTSTSNPSAIIQEHIQHIPKKGALNMPSEEAMRQMIRRQRRINFPAQPDVKKIKMMKKKLKKCHRNDCHRNVVTEMTVTDLICHRNEHQRK